MATVKRVIDGDTFETDSGQRIRLADVDAPEVGAPRSKQATERLDALIGDQSVAIKPVGTSYNRVIAEVSVGGKSVNDEMNKFLKKRAPTKTT